MNIERDFIEQTLQNIEEQKTFASLSFNALNNIVSIKGMSLVVNDLSKDAERPYFQAFVNGVQDDGFSHNEAIENALEKAKEQYFSKLETLKKEAEKAICSLVNHTKDDFFDLRITHLGVKKIVFLVDEE